MTSFVLLLALLVLFLVQSVLLIPFGLWFPARPDLLLVFVLGWTLTFGHGQGIAAAALAGLLMDSTSVAPFGSHTLALLLLTRIALSLERQLIASKMIFTVTLIVFATAFYYLVLSLSQVISGARVDWLGSLGFVVVPTALTNVVVGSLLFWSVEILAGKLGVQLRAASRRSQPVLRSEV